ncbi:hypothetical protein HGRIS_008045 [Hohenbuehelia grisea]|uniref:RNA helicase n=1 Tax=Hohenbuehelia grisea TaxID=104357 RepID=A0ABR3J7I1_9AGAR
MSRSAEAYYDSLAQSTPPTPSEPVTFESIGIRRPIVKALAAAFPNVQSPTPMQQRFIPALLSGKDVLLKDETGSGKSFGLVLALLNKERQRAVRTRSGALKPQITSLVIVPHRDLAYQFMHWIERIVNSPTVQAPPSLASLAQVVVRDGGSHLKQLPILQQEPPHILIGTPQALLDIHNEQPDALSLTSLSTVVVDEVDYLVDSMPIKDKNKTHFKSFLKAKRKLERHPSATKQLLDIIYARRKQLAEQENYEGSKAFHQRRYSPPSPQLVMSSATLRRHLDLFLFRQSGWLQKDNLAKCKIPFRKRSQNALPSPEATEGEIDGLGGSGILHSALVVTLSGRIKNIEGAIAIERKAVASGDEAITPENIFGGETNSEDVDIVNEANTEPVEVVDTDAKTRPPFNPTALEAIATAFALDVPSVALLVLPASAPVQRVVEELRAIGVNAQGLDLLAADKGRAHLLRGGDTVEAEPTLLVSTLATTRGLDLPHLTHVFILGIPEGPKMTGRTIDAYLHIAGRVGRFGRGGRVVSVVESTRDEDDDDAVVPVDEAAKMVRIFREAGVRPVIFEHFD